MTLFNSDYIEISSWEQFQKLSNLYLQFGVFVYSDSIPWSLKTLSDNAIYNLFSQKYTKLLTINVDKYPDLKEHLDINIFPMFQIYQYQTLITQVSPLFENITEILDTIL